MDNKLSIIVLCTLSTGIDSIVEVLNRGHHISMIIGVHPKKADPIQMSGWIDVAEIAEKYHLRYTYAETYGLTSDSDKKMILSMDADIFWVAGWQRLVPTWLIQHAKMGILGGHGSPDGIEKGRGRSPQNWALMLGCKSFELCLFLISPGIDDGPIIAQRTFAYNLTDDISISYKKVAIALGDMVSEVLENPILLTTGKLQQTTEVSYYPQRRPEDGYVDWCLKQDQIYAHCRALARPYPGLRSMCDDTEIVIWDCVPFDDKLEAEPGTIVRVFHDGSFLVSCGDGRLLVRSYSADISWNVKPKLKFQSQNWLSCLREICNRHYKRHPKFQISKRIENLIT